MQNIFSPSFNKILSSKFEASQKMTYVLENHYVIVWNNWKSGQSRNSFDT